MPVEDLILSTPDWVLPGPDFPLVSPCEAVGGLAGAVESGGFGVDDGDDEFDVGGGGGGVGGLGSMM